MCNTCLPCVTGDEYTTDVYQPLYTVQQEKKVYQFLRCAYINTYFFFFIFLHRSLYWSLHCWLHVYYGLYRIKSWNLPCEKLIGKKYLITLPTSMMLKWTLPNKYIYSQSSICTVVTVQVIFYSHIKQILDLSDSHDWIRQQRI